MTTTSYVHATITVKSGKMADFIKAMTTFAPHCERKYNLKLVLATRSDAASDVVVNCWKIPDHPPLETIMKELAKDPAAQPVKSCIDHESSEILVAMPYSP